MTTFTRSLSASSRLGYREGMGTKLAVSSMWTFAFYLGCLVAPTAGGYQVKDFFYIKTYFYKKKSCFVPLQVEYMGFESACGTFLALHALVKGNILTVTLF